jgi:hypothetical protein
MKDDRARLQVWIEFSTQLSLSAGRLYNFCSCTRDIIECQTALVNQPPLKGAAGCVNLAQITS